MDKFKVTKEKILAMASECSEAKAVLERGFPEAFKEEWEEIPVEEMRLARRGRGREGEIGVMIPPENFYMPYNIDLTDIWGGEREDGNPYTDRYVYKLTNGRIYRRER